MLYKQNTEQISWKLCAIGQTLMFDYSLNHSWRRAFLKTCRRLGDTSMPTFHAQSLHSPNPPLWMDSNSPLTLLGPWISTPHPSFFQSEGTSLDPPYSSSAPRFLQTPELCPTTQMLLSCLSILTFIPKSTKSDTSKEQHQVSTATSLHGSQFWRSFPLNKKVSFLRHSAGLLGCPAQAQEMDSVPCSS